MRVSTIASLWSISTIAAAQNPFAGPNGRCPSIQLFLVEAQGSSNLLGVAVAILDIAAGVNITSLPYAPSSDLSSTIEQGFVSTTTEIQTFSQKCPNGKIVLLGDAQGASYISATLAGTNLSGKPIPAGSSIGQQVAAVVLYRDATQAAGQGQQAACPTCSTGGSLARTGAYFDALQPFVDRLQNWCNADDASCCSSGSAQVSAGSYFTQTNRAYAINFISEKLGVASSFGPDSFPSSCPIAPPAPRTSTVRTSAPTTSLAATSEVPTTSAAAPVTTSAKTIPVPATYNTQQTTTKATSSPSSATQSNAKGSSASSASSLPSSAGYKPAADKTQAVPEVSRGAGDRLTPSAVFVLAAFGIAGLMMTFMI